MEEIPCGENKNMIICNDFIFIHLQKCAGTTIRKFLSRAFPECRRYKGEHDGISEIAEDQRGKFIVGTIRNPLDWYLSWYSSRKDDKSEQFKDLFKCEFKEFLRRCFFTEERTLHELKFRKLKKWGIGPYTHRYNCCYQTSSFEPNLHIIKTEELREGLIDKLSLSERQIEIFDSIGRLHSSKHGEYIDYYDQEMLRWVGEKDYMIFERHDYELSGKL